MITNFNLTYVNKYIQCTKAKTLSPYYIYITFASLNIAFVSQIVLVYKIYLLKR